MGDAGAVPAVRHQRRLPWRFLGELKLPNGPGMDVWRFCMAMSRCRGNRVCVVVGRRVVKSRGCGRVTAAVSGLAACLARRLDDGRKCQDGPRLQVWLGREYSGCGLWIQWMASQPPMFLAPRRSQLHSCHVTALKVNTWLNFIFPVLAAQSTVVSQMQGKLQSPRSTSCSQVPIHC